MAFVISLLSTFQGINPERCAQGGSCITSRRLHPHMFERPLVSQPGIHDTVESNTACHAQVIRMCFLVEPIDKLQSGFFEHNLQRMWEVDLPEPAQLAATAKAIACGSFLTSSIQCQHGSLIKG